MRPLEVATYSEKLLSVAMDRAQPALEGPLTGYIRQLPT